MSGTIEQPAPEESVGPWAQAIGLAFRVIFGLVLLAALAWPFSNIRQVSSDSRAVVLRFGRVVRVQGAGLLLAWPRPFEHVVFLPAPERQLEFTFQPLRPPSDSTGVGADWTVVDDIRENAAFFMTADGIVHLTATLFYRITDPVDYMLQQTHVPPALKALTVASLVSLIAARDTDTLVVTRNDSELSDADRTRRERIRSDLVSAINRRLIDLQSQNAGIGIEVTRVDLGIALPQDVKTAFDGVLVAAQQADTGVAQARSLAIQAEQKAQQDRSTILANANASASERTSLATTRTASVDTLAHAADGLSGTELLTKIYTDRMQTILHHAHSVEAYDPDTGARLLLPGQTP